MKYSVNFVVLVYVLGYCQLTHGNTQTDATKNLASLSKDYFEWRMSDRPEQSTYRGYHQYNDILESFLDSDFDTRLDKAKLFLTGLNAISRANLSRTDKVNYDILENMLTTFVDGYKWRHYNAINPLNILEGPDRITRYFLASFPFYTVGDFENYLARLDRLPVQLNQRINLFKMAIRKGTTSSRMSMNLVLDQIDNICPDTNLSVNCDYFKPFNNHLQHITLSTSSRQAIYRRGEEAVRRLLTKFNQLKLFLKNEYIPATRPNYGVINLVKGADYYQACLKWYTSVDITPKEVHDLGIREVKRINSQIRKIMVKNNFYGSVSEYYKVLQNDSTMFFETSEEMLEEYRHMIKDRIGPSISKLFSDYPDLPLRVVPMKSDGPMGTYSRVSADGSRPGTFTANVLRPRISPRMNMMALTLHEAMPGHHLQLSYNAVIKNNPDFRSKAETGEKFKVPYSFPQYNAYTEGWALYAESLGEELNLYKDDIELMGRYGSEIFRACRLVVDSGLHYYNWTKEDAVEYLANNIFRSLPAIKVEVDRYITWPGQACSYKIGELKFKDLRRRATEELGEKFDLREFHTFIMKGGIVPLNLLERNIMEWIEDKKTASVDTGPSPQATCSASLLSNQFLYIFVFLSIVFK